MLARILKPPLVMLRRATAAIDARASPLKPSVERFIKSTSVAILLVA